MVTCRLGKPHPEQGQIGPAPSSLLSSGGGAESGPLLCSFRAGGTGRPLEPGGNVGPRGMVIRSGREARSYRIRLTDRLRPAIIIIMFQLVEPS